MQFANDNGARVTLTAVTSGSKENDSFFRWTPSGEIRLDTVNDSAAEEFVPGTEFYIDFTKAVPVDAPAAIAESEANGAAAARDILHANRPRFTDAE